MNFLLCALLFTVSINGNERFVDMITSQWRITTQGHCGQQGQIVATHLSHEVTISIRILL